MSRENKLEVILLCDIYLHFISELYINININIDININILFLFYSIH